MSFIIPKHFVHFGFITIHIGRNEWTWMSNVCDIHVNKFRTSISLSSRHNFNKFKLILVWIFYDISWLAKHQTVLLCLSWNIATKLKLFFFSFKNKLLLKDFCVLNQLRDRSTDNELDSCRTGSNIYWPDWLCLSHLKKTTNDFQQINTYSLEHINRSMLFTPK